MNLNVSFELSKAGKLRKWVDYDAGEVRFNMMMLLMVDVDFVDFDDDGDSDMGLT